MPAIPRQYPTLPPVSIKSRGGGQGRGGCNSRLLQIIGLLPEATLDSAAGLVLVLRHRWKRFCPSPPHGPRLEAGTVCSRFHHGVLQVQGEKPTR